MKNFVIILFMAAGLIFAGNLSVNGDFEQDLSIAWELASNGYNPTITRGTAYDPDPDYEAYAFKDYGSGYAKLYQVIDLLGMSTADLDFSINAKVYAWDNNADQLCWAAAAVIITYMNESGARLGDTKICMRTTPCPWQNTSTCHLITATDSFWHNYSFNINDELGNLPGVNPSNVKKIEVALYDTTAHTC
jgi:hypothetical protein